MVLGAFYFIRFYFRQQICVLKAKYLWNMIAYYCKMISIHYELEGYEFTTYN